MGLADVSASKRAKSVVRVIPSKIGAAQFADGVGNTATISQNGSQLKSRGEKTKPG